MSCKQCAATFAAKREENKMLIKAVSIRERKRIIALARERATLARELGGDNLIDALDDFVNELEMMR